MEQACSLAFFRILFYTRYTLCVSFPIVLDDNKQGFECQIRYQYGWIIKFVSSNYRTYVDKYFVYYIDRLLGRSGETVYIHGLPYVFERRLGGGAFGK